jgi:hypothetical protein
VGEGDGSLETRSLTSVLHPSHSSPPGVSRDKDNETSARVERGTGGALCGAGTDSGRGRFSDTGGVDQGQFDESLFGAPVDSDDESVFSFDNVGRPMQIKSYSFLHWNVDGLASKLDDHNFVSYISSFDFVSLVETFMPSFDSNYIFDGFTVFCQPAVKLSVQGRPSGGVLCLIKNDLVPFVREIKVKLGNFLLFVINKELFGSLKDILFVCAYIPPEGSRYYEHINEDIQGIDLLENCLLDNALLENDFFVIVAGDLNGRTKLVHNQFLLI